VAAFTFYMGYESNTTGIMLLVWTIETMRLRQTKPVMHTHTRNLVSGQSMPPCLTSNFFLKDYMRGAFPRVRPQPDSARRQSPKICNLLFLQLFLLCFRCFQTTRPKPVSIDENAP
jgi:hypothetical protein